MEIIITVQNTYNHNHNHNHNPYLFFNPRTASAEFDVPTANDNCSIYWEMLERPSHNRGTFERHTTEMCRMLVGCAMPTLKRCTKDWVWVELKASKKKVKIQESIWQFRDLHQHRNLLIKIHMCENHRIVPQLVYNSVLALSFPDIIIIYVKP